MDDAELAQATEHNPAELVRAIEENAAELLMAMGAAGGGRQRDEAGVRWTIGGSPIDYHNAIVAADLTAQTADAVIAESLHELKNNNVPGSWHVGPSMRPADLGERLLAAGFTHGGSEPGMAIPLAELTDPAQLAGPAEPVDSARTTGLRVERVRTEEELGVWVETLGRGFGEGVREARWVGEVYRRLGLGDPWRHYLGWLDGEPVATTTIYLAAGVAGVYFVMTIPEARRRGIGTAITRAALEDARDTDHTVTTGSTGVRYGVLGSSPAGRSVYARLGFREYCTIDLYEWSPTRTD
ncbi:acetyltransferase (GNAT) family protein [Kribbella orskensis]|uniref:Acetyltransferase (GNAT) family protein n=1 Tax=Kribbella orskensis TaxID=2512216 RepID=A0ABY2BC72_9ACTN|nr:MULTISPECIES: GNAT family N-acetyltransferase [Kribbella]TCN34869.1 acetyltransferase (GNAT) family protein [Kribbella sp. VKM Ac-2500]TCO15575.1 acetyltransferase (GNAT) family protein [Kribbella orskensis]